MFKLKCDSCEETYKLKNVRIDEHWRDVLVTEHVNCYCPHCNAILKKITPDSVDLARNFNSKNIIAVCLCLGLWLVGLATESLIFFGPFTVILFGVYLAKRAKLKDHRIIGWLLIVLCIIILVWLNSIA